MSNADSLLTLFTYTIPVPSLFVTLLSSVVDLFFGLLDPDPFVRGSDPSSKKSKKNLDSYCFVTSS